jgi:hypothetical protein
MFRSLVEEVRFIVEKTSNADRETARYTQSQPPPEGVGTSSSTKDSLGSRKRIKARRSAHADVFRSTLTSNERASKAKKLRTGQTKPSDTLGSGKPGSKPPMSGPEGNLPGQPGRVKKFGEADNSRYLARKAEKAVVARRLAVKLPVRKKSRR